MSDCREMLVRYADYAPGVCSLLAAKLGPQYLFLEHSSRKAELLDCQVFIIALPQQSAEIFPACLQLLNQAVRLPDAPLVVALLRDPDATLPNVAIKHGAFDYWRVDQSLEELRLMLRRACDFHRMTVELTRLRCALISEQFSDLQSSGAPRMDALLSLASRVALTDATVLITGETGTGKEVLARAMHAASRRAREPFAPVACCSLPETLIESELFGHERGAFTGAAGIRKGRFEAVGTGTLFIDEVGELPMSMQVKLLRVLQERKFQRLGSNHDQEMHGRLIFATNRNLALMVADGTFRADLYYRLNTIELHVPPLRERRNDISVLAYAFLHQFTEKHGRAACKLSCAVLSILDAYDWPGNVRELQNVIERAVIMCDGPEVQVQHLPKHLHGYNTPGAIDHDTEHVTSSFEEEVRAFKRQLLLRALAGHNNNKVRTAQALGMARSSLHRLIEELHVDSAAGQGHKRLMPFPSPAAIEQKTAKLAS